MTLRGKNVWEKIGDNPSILCLRERKDEPYKTRQDFPLAPEISYQRVSGNEAFTLHFQLTQSSLTPGVGRIKSKNHL